MSVDEMNPYTSPKSPVEPGAPRRTQWRRLPAVILIMVGGVLAFCSIPSLVPMPLVGGSGVDVPSVTRPIGVLLMVLAGLIWIASGVAVWRGRWWLAALGIVVGYSLGLVASNLAFPGEWY